MKERRVLTKEERNEGGIGLEIIAQNRVIYGYYRPPTLQVLVGA